MKTWNAILRIVAKLALLGLIVLALWLITVFTAVNLPDTTWEYWRRYTNVMLGVGQRGGSSMIRFREVEEYRDIDIAFIGSSHCYRSFDPRIFDSLGLQSYNLGSRNQNLVNSYFLLKEHIGQLQPKLVIVEVYWDILGGTGLESYLDLAENYPEERLLIEMLWAIKDIRAANALLARWLEIDRPEYSETPVHLMPADTYIGRGYVEKDARYRDKIVAGSYTVEISDSQLDYLARIIELCHDQQAKVVLVVQPLPAKRLRALRNEAEVNEILRAFAATHDVRYLDFNQLIALSDEEFYYDSNHLTQRGVELFDRCLIQELSNLKLLPSKNIPLESTR